MSIKICFMGTHGTGKTTLAFEAHKWLEREKRIPCKLLCESTDRAVKDIPKYDPFYESILIQRRKELFMQHENFISDRSLIDPLGYQFVKKECFHPGTYKIALEATRKDAHILFYIPIAIPLKGEGHRPKDVKYQLSVAKAIKHVLHQEQLVIYEITRVDLVERLEFVKHILAKRIQIFGGSNDK